MMNKGFNKYKEETLLRSIADKLENACREHICKMFSDMFVFLQYVEVLLWLCCSPQNTQLKGNFTDFTHHSVSSCCESSKALCEKSLLSSRGSGKV